MLTIILPGFSSLNKEWAEEIKKKLNLGHSVLVHSWKHWQTGNNADFKTDTEIKKVLEEIGEEEVNILAKSIGTRITMYLLEKIPSQIEKIILCGIPLEGEGINEKWRKKYEILASFPGAKVLCLQNKDDPFGSFSKVKKFIHSISPQVLIKKMPRGDHQYPYLEEFQKFLSLRSLKGK